MHYRNLEFEQKMVFNNLKTYLYFVIFLTNFDLKLETRKVGRVMKGCLNLLTETYCHPSEKFSVVKHIVHYTLVRIIMCVCYK